MSKRTTELRHEAWECPYCGRIYDKTLNNWEREAADHLDACKLVKGALQVGAVEGCTRGRKPPADTR